MEKNKSRKYDISLVVKDLNTCIEFPLTGKFLTACTNLQIIAERWFDMFCFYQDKNVENYEITDFVVTLA